MSLILYAIPLFVLLILCEAWLAQRRNLGFYRLHDTITSLNIGLISEVFRGLQKLVTVLIYGAVVEHVGVFTFDVSSPAVWVLAFLLYDFFYYWAHRAGHEVNLLWAAHVVHHSSEEFNLSTALRQSSTNTLFYWVFYLPMALLGIPVTVFAITVLISLVYQYWIHTRLIPKLGWFEKVFNTPSHHRVHHGQNEYCIDKNYAATLIIWDRLFGTFAEERDAEPVVYGALTPLRSWNPLWANFKNYLELAGAIRHLPGWRNKLMHVFAPPGWTPLSDTPSAPPPLRFEPEGFKRFATPTSRWQVIYAVLAFTGSLMMLVHLLSLGAAAPLDQRVAYGCIIIASATFTGWLFIGRRWAVALEALRVGLVFGAVAAGVWFGSVAVWMQALAGLVCLVSWAALYQLHQETHASNSAAQGSLI